MVATLSRRFRVALWVPGVVLVTIAFSGSAAGDPARVASQPAHARIVEGRDVTVLRTADVAQQVPISWRGGALTASTGEVVRVFVSNSLSEDVATPEGWAEFLAGLTHGPELAALETRIATLAEVQRLCGARALGCYGRNQMISIGDFAVDGATPEEIVRHEYGHHVAFHRQNPPWRALEWGPKHWASAANVCARTRRNEAFPGDGGRNYSLNPGEAWAEVYRLMDERKAGIMTMTWPIIARSFFPSQAALDAAERDVVDPWRGPRTRTVQRLFGQRTPKVWWAPVSSPLDGELRVRVTVPRGGQHEVALVAGNRRTVVQRARTTGPRSRTLTWTVCGQRNLFVRVTQIGALGRVGVSITTP